MKIKVSKKEILNGMKICFEHGYFSGNTQEFLKGFNYIAMQKINTILSSLYNSTQPKASIYYNIAVENNLI